MAMIPLTDLTMAGCTDPARRLRKLRKRVIEMREHIAEQEEKILCMQDEITQIEYEKTGTMFAWFNRDLSE